MNYYNDLTAVYPFLKKEELFFILQILFGE